MMGRTKIEWCDTVWNPVTGCSPVSEGCQNCYAARFAKRLAGRVGYPKDEPFRVTVHADKLSEPLRWRKSRRVFVVSMGDLFHEDVPFEFIAEVFGVMAVAGAQDACEKESAQASKGGAFHGEHDGYTLIGQGPYRYPNYRSGPHTFLVLTKRPGRMQRLIASRDFRRKVAGAAFRYACNRRDAGYLSVCIGADEQWSAPGRAGRLWPLPNVWLGVSVENQRTADERIPILLQIPAAKRFVSCEPPLGAVDLTEIRDASGLHYRPLTGTEAPEPRIHWVIAGGETGPGARPSNLFWFRGLRDQCIAAGTHFFFKGHGEWVDPSQLLDGVESPNPQRYPDRWHGETGTIRVGKKAAGRLLDGREWNEVPQ